MSVLFCLFSPTLCMDYFYYYEGNLSLSLDEYIYTPLIMSEREMAVMLAPPLGRMPRQASAALRLKRGRTVYASMH